jgi:predicted short-subunit dehydrogenase-like oxidoreductase (DUF2520 family)
MGASVAASAREVVVRADLTLLTVPDDLIVPVSVEIADQLAQSGQRVSRGLVHTSGLHGADILQHLEYYGLSVGSLHPAYPFANDSLASLDGVIFAVETRHRGLRNLLHTLVDSLGGRGFDIEPGGKARYHAALVFASNYAVVLYAAAERLLAALKIEDDLARSALISLMQATLANLADKGVPDALTGPIVRGDSGTVAAHLAALTADADLHSLYKALALAALPLAEARGVDTRQLRATIETG